MRCCLTRWICSALISGSSKGTSSPRRYDDALEQTAAPAFANCGSRSLATSLCNAEKTIFACTASVVAGTTTISREYSGMGVSSIQRAADEYFCPTERSDAASATTLNQG